METHEDDGFQTNSMKTRGTQAITLNNERYSTGTHNFFSLVTGETAQRGSHTPLPMPDWVIQRVNDMGAAEGRSYANVVDFSDPFASEMPNLSEHVNDDDDSTHVDEDDDSCISNWADSLDATFHSLPLGSKEQCGHQ